MSALPTVMQRHLRAMAEVRAEIEYLDRIWPVVDAGAQAEVLSGQSPTLMIDYINRVEHAGKKLARTQRQMLEFAEVLL